MEYGELILGWYEDSPELFENIRTSDEAAFNVGGFIKRRNRHYWASSDNDLNMKLLRIQARPKVTIWFRMTETRVVGPCILRDTMNMRENYVCPRVSDWENIGDLIFM